MIISVFPSGEEAAYCLPMSSILRHIKTGTYKYAVNAARQFHRELNGNGFREALQLIPRFSPAGHFATRLRESSLITYSQCLLLETVALPSDCLEATRSKIEALPATLACFKNATGGRLQFLIRAEHRIEDYPVAFQQALEFYARQLPVGLNPVLDHPYQLCLFSYDPLAYFNPDALTLALPGESITRALQRHKCSRPD